MNIAKLPDKFKEEVTPAISRTGKYTIQQHPENFRKADIPEKIAQTERRQTSPDSDGSFEKQLREELEDVKWQFRQNVQKKQHHNHHHQEQEVLLAQPQHLVQSEHEKLKIKMEEACKTHVPLKEKTPVIQEVVKQPKSGLFSTVEREKALINFFENKIREQKPENKLQPKFTAVETSPKKIIKWKLPVQEHQFFYENDEKFRHNIDLELAREANSKRHDALKKLYFEYKNESTFKNANKLMKAMAVHKIRFKPQQSKSPAPILQENSISFADYTQSLNSIKGPQPMNISLSNIPDSPSVQVKKSLYKKARGERFQSQATIIRTDARTSQVELKKRFGSMHQDIQQESSIDSKSPQKKSVFAGVSSTADMTNDSVKLSSKNQMKALKIQREKLKQKKNREEQEMSIMDTGMDEQDSMMFETKRDVQFSVQKKKKKQKPQWRDKNAAKVSEDTLERFAIQLQNRQTLRHIQNEDPYNTLNDKTVQMHKQSRKFSKWLVDPSTNPDNAHEMRFVQFNSLPTVNSKIKKPTTSVEMSKGDGRIQPIVSMVSNEIVQLKKQYNDNYYDYDLKSTHPSITKQITFAREQRFDNHGIFGDLFDEKKQKRFGSALEGLFDLDKAEKARHLLKPRITEQKSFDQYVTRDVKSFEVETGSLCLNNILSLEDKRQQSVTSFKVYRELKEHNLELPSLSKVSHLDYLPNRIQKRALSMKH